MKCHKFKAWDKVNERWITTRSGGQSLNEETGKLEYTYSETFTLQNWETLRTIMAFPGDYKIIEWTGSTDVNATEVYEDDMFKWLDGHIEVIKWDNSLNGWNIDKEGLSTGKIIGNINNNSKNL